MAPPLVRNLPKVTEYVRNVGKSVQYATIDYFKGSMSDTSEFIETNQELFKDIAAAVKDYKGTLRVADRSIRKSKIYEAGTELKKTLFESIKTGKFYDPKREDYYRDKASGSLGDMSDMDDWGFDNSQFDVDDGSSMDSDEGTLLSNTVKDATTAQANIIAKSSEYLAEMEKANTRLLFAQGEKMYATVNNGLANTQSMLDRVNKFGDAYEVVYFDEGMIKSKVLDSSCCYPVYDDCGNYIAFIEYWTDAYTNISYYNVYYPEYVDHWSNEGGDLYLVSTDTSVGLPIHYHNFSDEDYNFGVSLLTDIKPIMDDLEDMMSKLGDAIYTNSMSVMPIAIGQRIESSIPADAMGYVLNLDNGDFKYASATMDYNTIKLYLDNLKQMIWISYANGFASSLGKQFGKYMASKSMETLYSMIDSFRFENCELKENWMSWIKEDFGI